MRLLTTPELSAVAGVRHGFSTRAGGVSVGPLRSLNLGMIVGEHPESMRENWRRVATALHPTLTEEHVALADQVHGAEVREIEHGAGPFEPVGSADGLVTARSGVVLGIRTADCVPVLLSAPAGVGAVHAGWRGVAADVVSATVGRLCGLTGCQPEDVVAAVGPHISTAAYEVGEEVVSGIAVAGIPEAVFVCRTDRLQVDLRGAVAWQLSRLGVHRIGHCHRCTYADPDLFSYRRDGPQTGRLGAVIVRIP